MVYLLVMFLLKLVLKLGEFKSSLLKERLLCVDLALHLSFLSVLDLLARLHFDLLLCQMDSLVLHKIRLLSDLLDSLHTCQVLFDDLGQEDNGRHFFVLELSGVFIVMLEFFPCRERFEVVDQRVLLGLVTDFFINKPLDAIFDDSLPGLRKSHLFKELMDPLSFLVAII